MLSSFRRSYIQTLFDMNNNFYWPVYKNLERELIELSDVIHINDEQLGIYSIKIVEMLIRTVVEVESISKELYFLNGGEKLDDKDLFFDTVCIGLLENKWHLSKKKVQISATNFYFNLDKNRVFTPLNKANKRGTSSSDWQKAYQAVKHSRVESLTKGNLKNLIWAMAGLFVLNLYYKDNIYELGKDATGTNFDNGFGSSIFSVKIHKNQTISIGVDYSKDADFDECIYLVKSTDVTRNVVRDAIKVLNEKVAEKQSINILDAASKQIAEMTTFNHDELNEKLKNIKPATVDIKQVAIENGQLLRTALEGLKYEAILNKQQY